VKAGRCLALFPRALGAKLLRLAQAAVVQQRFLLKLAEQLQVVNVGLLVLKGPVLAPLLYPSAVFRPSADLDIEVRVADIEATVAALEANGLRECDFDPEIARHEHAEHVHGSSAFHRVFHSQDGQILVEQHVDALQLGSVSADEARWARAVPAPGVRGALMLSLADQLVHLSVHVQKHGFNRFIWLKEIDLLCAWVRKQTGRAPWTSHATKA
jgi:Uncharacterised nucleotidyltransferase